MSSDYVVPMSAEVSDEYGYLYVSVGSRLIGIPINGHEAERVMGLESIIDAVRSAQGVTS